MKRKLIYFSALLIISLLVGIVSAEDDLNSDNLKGLDGLTGLANLTDLGNITGTNNTNSTNGIDGFDSIDDIIDNIGDIGDIDGFGDFGGIDDSIVPTNLDVDICYDKNGPFKAGDVVCITGNFDEPIYFAEVRFGDGLYSTVSMVNESDEDCNSLWSADYVIPSGVNGPVDVTILAADLNGNVASKTDNEAFIIDNTAPVFTELSPKAEIVNTGCVLFNFNAYDNLDSEITYALYINNEVKDSGVITSGSNKKFEADLGDGYYTWEVKLTDCAGNVGSSGIANLYVDTCAPSVTLVSPADCFVNTMGYLTFNFTAKDDLSAKYQGFPLKYQLYIDGEPVDSFGGDIFDDEIDIDDIFNGGVSVGEVSEGIDLGNITDGLDLGNITDGLDLGNNSTDGLDLGNNSTDGIDIGDIDDGIDIGDIDDGINTGSGSGTMGSGEYVEVIEGGVSDGVHNWSICVEDKAGNKVTSGVNDFYMDVNGLQVSLVSPNGGYVTQKNPEFNFSVSGGPGLPFKCKLMINGKVVDSIDCEGESGFTVGDDWINYYLMKAAIADGENIAWTVNVTDCAGNNYVPQPCYFTLDTVAPAFVANMLVIDAIGESQWSYSYDYPALYVSWDKNTEADLASAPYEIYISDFKPSCIEDMEEVDFTNLDTDLYIEEYGGEPLVYGKDYWVAVIARDKAGNYNDCFSYWGQVRTYEDMNISLAKGWNLKSVPKNLVPSLACTEDVFGKDSIVLYWDGNCWQFPKTIESCKGYWVYSPTAFANNIKFKPMSCDSTTPDVPASLDLCAGWQMIGHTATQSATWSTTLSSLQGDLLDYKFSNLVTYSNKEGWGGVIPDLGLIDLFTDDGGLSTGGAFINGTSAYPVGTLQYENYMIPGQGYWVFMKEDGTYASIENTYNYQDIYGSDGAVDDGTIDDGAIDDGFIDGIDDGIIDGLISEGSSDNGPASTGNETSGNETSGNETSGNETSGNETSNGNLSQ